MRLADAISEAQPADPVVMAAEAVIVWRRDGVSAGVVLEAMGWPTPAPTWTAVFAAALCEARVMTGHVAGLTSQGREK